MMAKKIPGFLFDQCISCSICVQECPVSCIELSVNGVDKFNNLYPKVESLECIGCSMCAKACPMEAIVMEETV
jgi:formate hydrogenlyase subunit 6/NADH:ubiquinone oxidoreductase subunit I